MSMAREKEEKKKDQETKNEHKAQDGEEKRPDFED